MALKISIPTSNVGVAFTDAYARINNIFGNKDQLHYQVSVSANESARLVNAQDVANYAFYCPIPQGDLMSGLYADLKLQAGFENAEDC